MEKKILQKAKMSRKKFLVNYTPRPQILAVKNPLCVCAVSEFSPRLTICVVLSV